MNPSKKLAALLICASVGAMAMAEPTSSGPTGPMGKQTSTQNNDHDKNDHGRNDHDKNDHGGNDHDKNDHGGNDHGGNDHGGNRN